MSIYYAYICQEYVLVCVLLCVVVTSCVCSVLSVLELSRTMTGVADSTF